MPLDPDTNLLNHAAPGISMFGSARAATTLQPEMMQLADAVRIRNDQQRDGYALRALDREEQSAISESDQLGQFSDYLLNYKDETPEKRAIATRDWMAANPNAAGNKYIKEAAESLAAADKGIYDSRQLGLDTRKQESESKDLDFMEGTRGQREEAQRLALGLQLEKSKVAVDEYKAQREAGAFDRAAGLGALIGRANGISVKEQESLVRIGELLDGEGNAGMLQGLSNLVQGFSSGADLEDAYKVDLQDQAPVLAALRKQNINIVPGMPAEEYAAAMEKAIRTPGGLALKAKMDPIQEMALGMTQMRQQLAAELPQLEAMAADPSKSAQLKAALGVWNLRANRMTGIQQADRDRRMQKLDVQKRELGLKKLMADMAQAENMAEFNRQRAGELADARRQRAQMGEAEFRLRVHQTLTNTDNGGGRFAISDEDNEETIKKKTEALDAATKDFLKKLDFKPSLPGTRNSVPGLAPKGKGPNLNSPNG